MSVNDTFLFIDRCLPKGSILALPRGSRVPLAQVSIAVPHPECVPAVPVAALGSAEELGFQKLPPHLLLEFSWKVVVPVLNQTAPQPGVIERQLLRSVPSTGAFSFLLQALQQQWEWSWRIAGEAEWGVRH